jgi:hypothetical protein
MTAMLAPRFSGKFLAILPHEGTVTRKGYSSRSSHSTGPDVMRAGPGRVGGRSGCGGSAVTANASPWRSCEAERGV